MQRRGSGGEGMLIKVSKTEGAKLHPRGPDSLEGSSKGRVQRVKGEGGSHKLDISYQGADGRQALKLILPRCRLVHVDEGGEDILGRHAGLLDPPPTDGDGLGELLRGDTLSRGNERIEPSLQARSHTG